MLVLACLADVYACSTCIFLLSCLVIPKLLSRRENLDVSSCSRSTWWPEGSHPAQTSKRAKGVGWHTHYRGAQLLCQVVNLLPKHVSPNLLVSHSNSTIPGVNLVFFGGVHNVENLVASESSKKLHLRPQNSRSSAVPGAIIAKPKHKGRGLSNGVSRLDSLLFLMPSCVYYIYIVLHIIITIIIIIILILSLLPYLTLNTILLIFLFLTDSKKHLSLPPPRRSLPCRRLCGVPCEVGLTSFRIQRSEPGGWEKIIRENVTRKLGSVFEDQCFFPNSRIQNAMGSLRNIDFGVFWASWGASGKKPGSGNRFRELVPGTVRWVLTG